MYQYDITYPSFNVVTWGNWNTDIPSIEIKKGQENYYQNLLKFYQKARPEFFKENNVEGRPISEILYNLTNKDEKFC